VAGEVIVEAAGWTTDGEDAAFATTIGEGIRGTWDGPGKASATIVKDGTMEGGSILIDVVEVAGKCDGGRAAVIVTDLYLLIAAKLQAIARARTRAAA
jgi:hypothetical protein